MYDNLDYIAYPLPEDIEHLVEGGDLKRAKKIIEQRIAGDKLPECLKERLRFELKIIDYIPHCFTLTEEEMLAQLQSAYENVTFEEMEDLRDAGTLDWHYIDGKVYYKTNALNNTIKTRPDMNDRLKDKSRMYEKNILDEVIAKMKKDGHMKIKYRIRTTLSIEPEAQEEGKVIKVHLPLPMKDAQCTPGEIVTNPPAKHIADETHPQRTAYFEEVYKKGMTFSAEYDYTIDAPYVNPDPAKVCAEQPHFSTEEVAPQIVFTPFIRALCDELKGDETNPLLIARKFYNYCTVNCCYRFVPAYYTKPNIPEFFAATQRADCGMHALLFITLCRCAGIPARWQAGYCTEPFDVGNHDWAMFYVAPYGWLFCDGSYGGSAYRAGAMDRWDFYFGNLDPYRMVANADIQQEFDPPKKFLRYDPYDSQDGEAEYEDRGLTGYEYDTDKEMLSIEVLND